MSISKSNAVACAPPMFTPLTVAGAKFLFPSASDKVSSVKVGDRVGVGAQIWSCLKCKQCKSDNENYCPHMVGTCSMLF